MPATQPVSFSLTNYVELFKDESLPGPITPFGPGYDVLFDTKIEVDGWKEIRLWVHVFIDNYTTTPLTANANLQMRFMHDCGSGSFDYEIANIHFNGTTSYINGYAIKPIIGKELRLLCHPTNLPTGPYTLGVTYLLVR
jgi:hypothetical protein